MCPSVSIAREVMLCSPEAGFAQFNDQSFHANSTSSPLSMLAGSHGPPSIWTSTCAMGAPPGCANDPILSSAAGDFRRCRLEQSPADGRLRPDGLSVDLLLTDGHVVARHEPVIVAGRQHL